jgi:hypothetical protein
METSKPPADLTMPQILDTLRRFFPNGHQHFIPLTLKELELHSNKNFDYANGGDPLGNFKRVAALLQQYPYLDLATPQGVIVLYLLKQLDAYLWAKSQAYSPQVEGLNARLQDISVYIKLLMITEGF